MNNMESLPPILRNLSHHQPPSLTPDHGGNPTQYLDPLPIIDLQSLNHDKNKLEEACKQGLFRLVNHGIPSTLLSQLQNQAKEVFCLSFETKQAFCDASFINYFWGTPDLNPSGTMVTSDRQNVNLFEGFDIPLAQLSQFQQQFSVLESFRFLLVEYENHLSRIATALFEAMVENLDLNLESSRSYLAKNARILRVYRYPYCSNPDVGLGLEEHTDSSIFTILNQEDVVSGLQVLRDDQWLTVKPMSNTLIVNIGDLMQAMSNDKYKSVLHRVKINNCSERISICYFVFAGEGIKVESSKYKPFTSNEFLAQVEQDIKVVGHKIGLPRFKRTQDN